MLPHLKGWDTVVFQSFMELWYAAYESQQGKASWRWQENNCLRAIAEEGVVKKKQGCFASSEGLCLITSVEVALREFLLRST